MERPLVSQIPGFRYAVKVNRFITHLKKLFAARMGRLGGGGGALRPLGVVLFQQ